MDKRKAVGFSRKRLSASMFLNLLSNTMEGKEYSLFNY